MERFKKRSLVLVLASVITVAGACFGNNYKNSLMSLEFEKNSANSVNVILHTKIDDGTSVIPKKIDSNTYIIMLPETDDKSPSPQKTAENIASVNKKTLPYTSNGSGYTKITIKTLSPNTELSATKTIYTPSEDIQSIQDNITEETSSINYSNNTDKESSRQYNYNKVPAKKEYSEGNLSNKTSVKSKPDVQNKVENYKEPQPPKEESLPAENTQNVQTKQETESDTVLWVLGIFIVLLVCIFIIIKSSHKMEEIVGEKMDFSDIDKNDKKQSKKRKITETVNNLDKMYKKPVKMPKTEDSVKKDLSKEEEQDDSPENVIVDLDELFQSNNNSTNSTTEEESASYDSENIALDDFLSGFDFEAEEEKLKNEIESNNRLEELFEKYIKNGSVVFSQSDINRINELLNSEINNDTLKNISKYAVSNPIKQTQKSKNDILENLITSYTINQNLSFTKDDVDALNKLINVEIDNDFLTDMTTNPERTSQMRKEIEARQVAHKSHEILTLNVKDMLPDLSEALKKQSGKKIEYEVKPQVVYYNDQYDVSKLNVSDELPDLTLDFDNPEYNKYRPSDNIELAAEGYDVEMLTIKDELPDLNDALKHPEKYREKETKVTVDEDSLLKSISNVTFKPFYDGEESFDISNKFKDDDNIFENYKEEPAAENNTNQTEASLKEKDIQPAELLKLNKTTIGKKFKKALKNEAAENLMKIIDTQKEQRKQKLEAEIKQTPENKETDVRTCSAEGESFEVLNTAKINEDSGCRLCKNESGYAVVGYIRRKLKILKKYKKLNSQRIQIRINENLAGGITQYIVRTGTNKFIINVSEDSMEYIMDLC